QICISNIYLVEAYRSHSGQRLPPHTRTQPTTQHSLKNCYGFKLPPNGRNAWHAFALDVTRCVAFLYNMREWWSCAKNTTMSGVKRKACMREEASSIIPKKHGRRSRNVREELDDVMFFYIYIPFVRLL
ncbi:unnamed protein product, partial [Onchocerca flexuosa]|uniref:Transposase n=1 Tax=Onchocerca flexuosa TaxID=387005 RepID=A0A183HTF8_9BILA